MSATDVGTMLVAATLVIAAADWVAVARGNRRAEHVLKPLTMVALIAAAVALRDDVPTARWALVLVALSLSLLGDVLLMLGVRLFVGGLASFLLAHVAYIAAFNVTSLRLVSAVLGLAFVSVMGLALFGRIRAGILAQGRSELVAPVAAYVVVLSGTLASAIATIGSPDWTTGRSLLAVEGALLFYLSDAMIGWTRFVQDFRSSRVAIMITYHLGQIGLVLALLREP